MIRDCGAISPRGLVPSWFHKSKPLHNRGMLQYRIVTRYLLSLLAYGPV